jgi:hypothetical protein
MKMLHSRMVEVRFEAVTASFVASGTPEGIHDLGRLLESLNNPAIARQIELARPSVRPLYRAGRAAPLEAPLLVRRDEIIFANFEGPYFTRGTVKPTRTDTPVLLLAPPFQIQGVIGIEPGADATQALRRAMEGFFVVRHARVFDGEGVQLGEGEQIIVNGGAVQMVSATRRRIAAGASRTPGPEQASEDAAPAAAREPRAA